MDLILAAKGKCVSLLQIFIFFIACLHPCISFHCARRTVLLPLVNMAIHYLKWQVLLQYAVTCLRFWADQNLTGFLLIFLFFFPFLSTHRKYHSPFHIWFVNQTTVMSFQISDQLETARRQQLTNAIEQCMWISWSCKGHSLVHEAQDLQLPISQAKRENIPRPICLDMSFRFDKSLSKPRVNFMKLLELHEYRLIRKFLMASS